MQDFTLSGYEHRLWIHEILNLQRCNPNNPRDKSYSVTSDGVTQPVCYFTFFGTVVNIIAKDEFKLFTVDDGTGSIVCRKCLRDVSSDLDALEVWNWDDPAATSATSFTVVSDATVDDTVFNNQSVQQEERDAYERVRQEALESLRWSLINSFCSSEHMEVGDAVCVHGRLYTYMNVNQIHINVIRLITMQEELILMHRKLELSRIRLGIGASSRSSDQIQVSKTDIHSGNDQGVKESQDQEFSSLDFIQTRRVSGLLTFDNVTEKLLTVPRAPNTFAEIFPPSPEIIPGYLSVTPPPCEIPPPFDTFFVEEVSVLSSSDDEFIPSTPLVKRLKRNT